MQHWSCYAFCVIVLWRACSATTLLFSDSDAKAYLRSPSGESALSPAGLSLVLRALLQARPLSSSAELSEEVDALLKPDIFSRPQAVFSVHFAGLETVEELAKLGGSLPATEVAFTERRQAASKLLSAVSQSAAYEPGLSHKLLDHTSLPGCGDTCVEEALKAAVPHYGANYTTEGAPMTGVVQARHTLHSSLGLHLSNVALRLWAVELAALHRSAKDAVEEKARKEAQEQAPDRERQLFDCTLLSLQGLSAEFGADSPEYQAAGQLLVTAVANAQAALAKAYSDRLVTMVALLGEVPATSNSLKGLLVWRENQRRRSLLQDQPSNSTSADSNQFSTSAAAWISGLIMVFFLVTGCYCLANMQFKQDSLLYPRTKTD